MRIPQLLETYTVLRASGGTVTSFGDRVPSLVAVADVRVRAYPTGLKMQGRHEDPVTVETWKVIANAGADIRERDHLVGPVGTLLVEHVYQARLGGKVHHLEVYCHRADTPNHAIAAGDDGGEG